MAALLVVSLGGLHSVVPVGLLLLSVGVVDDAGAMLLVLEVLALEDRS